MSEPVRDWSIRLLARLIDSIDGYVFGYSIILRLFCVRQTDCSCVCLCACVRMLLYIDCSMKPQRDEDHRCLSCIIYAMLLGNVCARSIVCLLHLSGSS